MPSPDQTTQDLAFRAHLLLNDHGGLAFVAAVDSGTDTRPTSSWIVDERHEGKPIAKINKTWRAVRRNAGLAEEIVPYTIRHTMATELITRGVPDIEVATFMGHAMPNLRTTGRYVHVRPDYLSNARKVIDEIASAIDRAATQSMVNLNMRAIRVPDDHAEAKEPTADAPENFGFLPL